jgi:hypothetical protein
MAWRSFQPSSKNQGINQILLERRMLMAVQKTHTSLADLKAGIGTFRKVEYNCVERFVRIDRPALPELP